MGFYQKPPTTMFVVIAHEVPTEFCEVAHMLKLEPEHLAKVLCEAFAMNPPERLIIVARACECAAADALPLLLPIASG